MTVVNLYYPFNNKITLFMKQFLVFFAIRSVLAGTIKQGLNLAPIWNSIANANVIAEYQFNFILDTYLPAGGQLEVTFPSQYNYNLGTTQDQLTCSVDCTVNDHILTFTFPIDVQNGTTYTVSAQPITNPPYRGGTGNFILKSKRGENVLDENLIFGLIGIADTIFEMVFATVILDPAGSYYAGDYTSYILYFKTRTTIPTGSYMIFTIPNQFQLEHFPACSSLSLNGQIVGGQIFCSRMTSSVSKSSDIQIRISGIQGQIKALIDYALKFSMKNPIYAGMSNKFSLGIYKEGTQMMYEQKQGIQGVTIQPAQLQKVSMTPVYTDVINSRSRIMDYEIKFSPTFPLPAGCNIKIIFPAYMKIMMNSYFGQPTGFQIHYVNYGLEDINEDSPIGFFYLNQIENYLRITNFKEMTMPNEISIIIRARNPDAAGYTTPLKIYVFQDITEYQLMALDVVNGKTVVQDYKSGSQVNPFPDTTSLTILGSTIADQNLMTTMTFNIYPSVSVPKQGYIKVKIPNQFRINSAIITNTLCQIMDYSSLTYKPSFECYLEGTDTITIHLRSDFGFDILLFQKQTFTLQNLIFTPDRNGTFFFDITTFDTDGKRVLDTYAQFVIISPNPLPVISFTVDTIPRQQNTKAIIDIVFINLLTIPASDIQRRATDLQGSLEFQFSSMSNDLGTGLPDGANISCYGVNGLVPISGNQLYCRLRLGTIATLPTVVVKLFKEIPPNTKIRLLLSGVTTPTLASYGVTLKIISKVNRISTILNTAGGTSLLAAQLPSLNCIQGPSYSENRVGFQFDMTIAPCLTSNVNSGDFIVIQLPSYDVGFLQFQNTITCQVNNIDIYCIPMVGSDFILLIAPSMIISSSPKIKLKNLQWPSYVQDFTVGGYQLGIQIIDPVTKALKQNLVMNNINSASPSHFDEIISVVPKKGKGQVDASYEFKFYPQVPLPEGSVIVLTFPSFYNLLSGAKFVQTGLQDIDSGNKVSIVPNLFLIKVTNFKQQVDPFILLTTGIKNSNDVDVSSGWKVQVLLNNKLVLEQLNFFSFSFSTPFKPGKIVFNQVTASNLNADEEAIYKIMFTPQTDIPIGGIIEITFPEKNYKNIPRSPDCRLFGGISTFQTCQLNGNTYIVETAQKYTFGNGVIIFQLRDVANPDQGETDGFVISTQYDGVYLDVTDETTIRGRTFISQKKTVPISVQEVKFDPKNEGEEAAYSFKFVTTNALDVTKELYFLFPIEFDPLLGRDIQCVVFSGLVGKAYKCKAENRAVTLSNFESYIPNADNPIYVIIYGIVNPNTQAVNGWIKIYSRPQNSVVYDESNSEAAQLSYQKAPGWSPLLSIQLSTNFVRWKCDYNFTMKTYSAVPKKESNGAILVDFPVEFEIPDQKIQCKADFAPSLSCSSYRNRIRAEGNYEDYVGNIQLQLKKVDNPVERGRSNFLFVRSYDGMNSIIIERNFNNLDPFQFDYFYPGPLIKVNNDKPIPIERGTQNNLIPVTITEDGFDSPCVLNLKLTPQSQPQFSILPYSIPIPLGATLLYFTISVPQSLSDGNYYIYWDLINELQPPLYTPVKKTIIVITKQKSTKINQTPILQVPLLGQSLLTEYFLDAPPDTGLAIQMNLLQQYKGIRLTQDMMNFTQGKSRSGFTIEYDDKITSGIQIERGWISLVESGINKNVFKMAADRIEFNIIAQDTQFPKWVLYTLSKIKRTSFLLTVIVDEPVMIYTLCALRGTVIPTISDGKSQRIIYPSTESQWGYIVVRQGQLTYQIIIENLTAETDYVLYLLGHDRGNNELETKTLLFTTQTRPNACDFTLKFKKKSYDSDYVRQTITSLANVFGINDSMIQQKKYYFADSVQRRALQNKFTQIKYRLNKSVVVDEIAVYMDLQLMADAKSDSFPAPIDVLDKLVNKSQLLSARLPDIDLSSQVLAKEFIRYMPEFVTRPEIVFTDSHFCAFKIQLDYYGFVFALAIKFENHKQPLPTPYQIMKGLDYQNRLTPTGMVEVSSSYQDFIVAIENLDRETDYFVYLVAGSTHPGYPDLMDQNSIYVNRIITAKDLPLPKLNINVASFLLVVWMITLLI